MQANRTSIHPPPKCRTCSTHSLNAQNAAPSPDCRSISSSIPGSGYGAADDFILGKCGPSAALNFPNSPPPLILPSYGASTQGILAAAAFAAQKAAAPRLSAGGRSCQVSPGNAAARGNAQTARDLNPCEAGDSESLNLDENNQQSVFHTSNSSPVDSSNNHSACGMSVHSLDDDGGFAKAEKNSNCSKNLRVFSEVDTPSTDWLRENARIEEDPAVVLLSTIAEMAEAMLLPPPASIPHSAPNEEEEAAAFLEEPSLFL